MASEADVSEPSFLERLISSRNRDISLFLPIILGFTNTLNSTDPSHDFTNPDQESPDGPPQSRGGSRDRIILINPLTQGMVVIEGRGSSSPSSNSSLDSLLRDLLMSKDGQPPASKASIEAMPSVEISEGDEDGGECAICLEDWEIGGGWVVKEMPCKHRFHGNCIEKWLGIHGSCPVCRYKMPVDDDDDDELNKKIGDERERRGSRREIWVSFSFNSGRRSEDSNQTAPTTESNDSHSSP